MRPPAQFEIEKYANEIFTADIEDRAAAYAKHQARALAKARASNNSGASLPVLIKCKQERLRAEILLLAGAWVDAATIFAVALGDWAEKDLEKAAKQMAAGINSALRGELDLRAARTKRPRNSSGGEREIHSAMKSTLRRAHLRFKAQRIKIERGLEKGVRALELAPEGGKATAMQGEVLIAGANDYQKTASPGTESNEKVPASLKRTRREPHPNPEIILAGKNRITYDTASDILGVTKRRVSQLVLEGHLIPVGKGHAKQISTASISVRLCLPTNSEEGGNKKK